jgi:hypothetical protein
MWALNIIFVYTPIGEVARKSSSYDLSIFCSGANSTGAKIFEAASGGSCLSIGELWPNIDKLYEIQHGDNSVMHAYDILVRGKKSTTSVEKAHKCSRHEGKKALLKDVPGTSNVKSKGHGGSSAKK